MPEEFDKIFVVDGFPRFHRDRNRLTGGGVSSGLDETLHLVRLLKDDDAAREVQRKSNTIPRRPSDLRAPLRCTFSW